MIGRDGFIGGNVAEFHTLHFVAVEELVFFTTAALRALQAADE
jgi:hypothetical protein